MAIKKSNDGPPETDPPVYDESEIEQAPFETTGGYNITKVYSLETMLNLKKADRAKLPFFQRNYVWKTEQRQSFICSLLNDVPMPIIFLAIDDTEHDPAENFWVLDGFQRITTLERFFDGQETTGNGLFNEKYHNLTYKELPKDLKARFLHANLTVTEVHKDRDKWPYIFRQLNKGGTPLNSMEIRRATYPIDLVMQLENLTNPTNNKIWANMFGITKNFKGLASILRSVALHYQYAIYAKPMEQFIDEFCRLQKMNNSIDPVKLKKDLYLIMECLYKSSNKMSFRLKTKKQINLGVVDCLIHAGLIIIENQKGEYSQAALSKALGDIRTALLEDDVVYKALTFDTSGRESINKRMAAAEALAWEFLSKKSSSKKK